MIESKEIVAEKVASKENLADVNTWNTSLGQSSL
jgi:hypothetical protein